MSTAADLTIAALRSGHDDLAAVATGLTADDLTRASAATEWDIAQVLGHLGSGAVIGLAALDAALAGEPNPGMELNRRVWARWDAMSPQEKADGFVAADAALVERYEGLDVGTRESLRVDLGFLPQPLDVAGAGRFRLSESSLHSWDVRAGLDPAAAVRPDAVPLLLGQVAMVVAWVGKADALGGRTATLRVTTSDPDSTFGLSIADGVSLVDAPPSADGTVTLPAEAWLRLVTGRLRPGFTPDGVEVTGDVDLDALRRVFPGF